jgi:hypothetical protein
LAVRSGFTGSVCIYIIRNEVKLMKELYLDAEIEVVEFAACDVIATSTAVVTTAESMGPPDEDAWADL